jgi:N-acetylneuraminic acid mutarotase
MAIKPAFSSNGVAENTWTQKAPMQQARHELGAAVVNGKIYAIGGTVYTYQDLYRVESKIVGTNEEYDTKTDTWSFKASMPAPRSGFATVVYQNKIYCIGGSNGSSKDGQPIPVSVNEVYDPATDTWERKAPMPTARLYAAANIVGGKIYVIGGAHNRTFTLTRTLNEMYDPATDTWTTKAPALYDQSGTSGVFNNKIYFFSSYGTQSYDPATDSWSTWAPPPETLHTLPATVATAGFMAPKRFYIFSGALMPQVYDPEADSWTLGSSFSTSRGLFAIAVVDDIIYVIGGMVTVREPSLFEGPFGAGIEVADKATVEAYTPFGYGTVPPIIEVASPQHVNYSSGDISLNLTTNRSVDWLGYSLDGQDNVTVTSNITLSGLTAGFHNVTVYATDEYGNTGTSETIVFAVVPEPLSFVPVAVASVAAVAATISVFLLVYFKKRKH